MNDKEKMTMSRWKPKQGEIYYFVSTFIGIVNFYIWEDDDFDKHLYEIGNCFQTAEEAERILEKVKELFFNFHQMKKLEEMFVICKKVEKKDE